MSATAAPPACRYCGAPTREVDVPPPAGGRGVRRLACSRCGWQGLPYRVRDRRRRERTAQRAAEVIRSANGERLPVRRWWAD